MSKILCLCRIDWSLSKLICPLHLGLSMLEKCGLCSPAEIILKREHLSTKIKQRIVWTQLVTRECEIFAILSIQNK